MLTIYAKLLHAETVGGDPPVPGEFSITAPADGATGVSLTPTVEWESSSNATSYNLVIANSFNFNAGSIVLAVLGITGTSYLVGSGTGTIVINNLPLVGGVTHFVQVAAGNANGEYIAESMFTCVGGDGGGGGARNRSRSRARATNPESYT